MMRFMTIWTMPAMTLREKIARTGEWVMRGVAHRLPRRLAYWSYIDTTVRHLKSDEVVPEVPAMTILGRMDCG